MVDHIETELKLKLLQPVGTGYIDVWQQVWRSELLNKLVPEQNWSITTMEARYYDTQDQALQKAGFAYRVRREGDNWVATVKNDGSSEGGLHKRAEWNLPSPDGEPCPELFAELPVGLPLLQAIADQPLVVLFITEFERRSVDLQFENAYIELAVDSGNILAGELSEPILELELELKAGEPRALLRLGASLAREIPLLPEPKSKFYRALLLAGIVEPQPTKPLMIEGQVLLYEGLSQLFAQAIDKLFHAYQSFLEEPEAPRRVHKMRVKLRRLRSLLLFAKPCILEEDFQTWKQALAAWGHVFGPLRELDVVAVEWDELCASPFISFDSKPWLGETMSKRRIDYLKQVMAEVGEGQWSSVLLEMWAWSEGHPWQQGECPGTIGSFARWRIGGWIAALLDAGKSANWENDQELHDLRLRLKRIRYTLVALPFYADRRTEKLLLQAEQMQSLFGVINDRATAGKTLSGLARGATRAVYRDIGLLSGWQARGELDARGRLQEQWKEFKQVARRWLEA